jgi:hypothetical protein
MEKGKVSVVNRYDLIWLKKNRNSDQDKIDIKSLQQNKKRQKLRRKVENWTSFINSTKKSLK